MTADGAHYVAVRAPVSNPVLPDAEEMPEGDAFQAWADDYQTYLQDRVGQLNAQPASSFTPDLAALDALVQSLLVQ